MTRYSHATHLTPLLTPDDAPCLATVNGRPHGMYHDMPSALAALDPFQREEPTADCGAPLRLYQAAWVLSRPPRPPPAPRVLPSMPTGRMVRVPRR